MTQIDPAAAARWDARYLSREHAARFAPDPLLVRHRNLLHGSTVDLACGEGANALLAAMCGCEVTGIDNSRRGLERATALCTRFGLAVRFEARDVAHWQPAPASLDTAMMFFFLDRRLFTRLGQAMRPGGVVIVRTFNRNKLVDRPGFNSDFVLDDGELVRRFADFDVIDSGDVEHGDSASFLVARKAVDV